MEILHCCLEDGRTMLCKSNKYLKNQWLKKSFFNKIDKELGIKFTEKERVDTPIN